MLRAWLQGHSPLQIRRHGKCFDKKYGCYDNAPTRHLPRLLRLSIQKRGGAHSRGCCRESKAELEGQSSRIRQHFCWHRIFSLWSRTQLVLGSQDVVHGQKAYSSERWKARVTPNV